LSLTIGALACAALALPALSQAAGVEVEAIPGSVGFAPTLVGGSSASQEVTFTNRGAEPIVIEGQDIAEATPDFAITNFGCGGELANGEHCDVGVSFTPQGKGARSAELQLQLVTEGATVGVPLSGEGIVKAVTLPAAVGFGTVTRGSSSEGKVTVANSGNATVTISKFELAGPDAGDFMVANNPCPESLGPAMSCELTVRFTPTAVGAEEARLKAITDGSPSEPSSELSGEGAAAELVFEPTSESFGLVEANSEGTEATLELENAGAAQVHIEQLGIFGSGANEFFIGNSNCYGATLLPGQSCSIVVHFDPHNQGTFSAALRAQVDNGAGFEAALSGRGGRPIVTATPDPAAFGEAGVGTLGALHTLTLTNSGELPVSFFLAFVSGGDVSSFRMVEENCTGRVIAPTETCTALIRFTPAAAGTRKATVSFFGAGEGALQIPLSGVGIAAKASLGPAGHDFGAQAAGTAGPSQTFSLTNESAAPLEIDTAAVSGLDPDQFRLAADACVETTLAPGASCSLGVRFAPEGTGARSAVLRVRTSAGTQTAVLTGEGVAAAPGAAPAGAGRVSFKFPASLRLGRSGGSALRVATARCESSVKCVVRASSMLLARFHRDGGLVARQISIPDAKVTLEPGASLPLSIAVEALDKGFAASKSTLKVQLRWSTGGAEGRSSRSPRLHG
jgi:hypothetical protein